MKVISILVPCTFFEFIPIVWVEKIRPMLSKCDGYEVCENEFEHLHPKIHPNFKTNTEIHRNLHQSCWRRFRLVGVRQRGLLRNYLP